MKKYLEIEANYSNWQIFSLTFLRILIGWHFLYEGLTKLNTLGWTAKGYLLDSVGPFSPLFKGMVQSDSVIKIVDILNEWGLVVIGFCLFIGLLSKPCKISGIVLLSLYYLAYPPFASLGLNAHVEGSYWIVNKNLIEMAALLVLLMFPSSHSTGFDRFFVNKGVKQSK
ncbi:MAG TPA: DoxX subfamily [Prolixibacteraceae bacterium]|nr:DoxX subfamily [Prolixibacteraceae bacterium]